MAAPVVPIDINPDALAALDVGRVFGHGFSVACKFDYFLHRFVVCSTEIWQLVVSLTVS